MREDSSLSNVLRLLGRWLEPLSDTPALDAQVLLTHVLGKPRSWVLAHTDEVLDDATLTRLEQALHRLEGGEALPYVLGEWEFYGLTFTLTPAVLIPRPETEMLVEKALHWLRLHPERRLAAAVGCGSGCIAVSLAKHVPDLRLQAVDLSPAALEVARCNAVRQAVERQIDFFQGDLLAPLHQPLDLICANLPYIPSAILPTLQVRRREPSLALDGGSDGLQVIQRLIAQAPIHLAPGGVLFVEIEASQGAAVMELAQAVFPRASSQVIPDLAGRDRLLSIATWNADPG